jgi:hypothetical protein
MVSRVFAATPPSVPDDGEGRTSIRIARKARHARLVAENGAAGPCRGGINGKNRNLVTFAGQIGTEHIDCGDSAPGAPVMPRRTPLRVRQYPARWCAVLRWSARLLDQRDRTRQHRAVARSDALN